ncbi:CENP-B N-terminal DNA-binding domain [Popillia japonica]|uniref:CENP-B N-terminal DNA-binding domain n=1 Tax=Popillia japonica TaxID=7064 RepID=A0AAW1KGL9_POPJA
MAPPKPALRRQSWSTENMQRAINAVVSKHMGWLKASQTFNVPKNTLRRRVEGKNNILKGSETGFLGGVLPVFSPEVESKIVEHLKTWEAPFFGLTPTDLKKTGLSAC